jgi:acetyl esterase/lipase
MKKLIVVLFVLHSVKVFAQEKIYLYPSTQQTTIEGVDKEPPFIEYHKANPDSVNGTAILVIPGGSYSHLADQHEGVDVAKFYNQHGFEAFVLHYRVNNAGQTGHRYPDQYNDVTTAMRIIKSRAKEWKIDPEKTGVIGFSAGGHLASTLGTMVMPGDRAAKNPADQFSTRPAFMLLIYPVISLNSKYTHKNSAEMLLGKTPDPKMLETMSTNNRVTSQTPPTFIVFSNDDDVVPVENGVMMYEALRKEKIPVSFHVYDHGGHGYGLAPRDPVLHSWTRLSVEWLTRLGYQPKKR